MTGPERTILPFTTELVPRKPRGSQPDNVSLRGADIMVPASDHEEYIPHRVPQRIGAHHQLGSDRSENHAVELRARNEPGGSANWLLDNDHPWSGIKISRL